MEEQIPYHAAANEEIDLEWRESVRETRQRLTNHAKYLRNLNLGPYTLTSQSNDPPEVATVNLGDFWAEQEEFLFLYLLIDAIRSGRPVSEARSLLTRFVAKPPKARIGAFVLTPEIYADFQIVFGVRSPHHNTHESYGEILRKALLPQIEKSSDQEIASAAIRLVQLRVNSRLSTTFPSLSMIDSGSIQSGIERSWSCRNLLGALYVMLFLDIEHQRRVVRCEGCGVLFQDAKDNVLYCSSRCETRTRVRKWWRKKGKNYRAKQRKKSKIARKSKSVPKSAAGLRSRGHSRS
jgi:hypothetical protein